MLYHLIFLTKGTVVDSTNDGERPFQNFENFKKLQEKNISKIVNTNISRVPTTLKLVIFLVAGL
jgi:hypothetical protein